MKILTLFFALLFSTFAHANSLDLAKQDGVILLMRHAIAPGGGDPSNFTLNDCSTQRNLSDAGREQARATGKMLRDAGVEIDLVATSQWCRCRETAQLLDLGEPQDWPSLNSFFGNRSREPEQTRETLEKLKALPAGTTAMLVTHQVNITALTNVVPRSGEIIMVRVVDGELELVGMIAPR
ncbi:histidine phosphatase family protein [Pseudahrensia aquimaris]|uniref:Histidine phosphatase family protein n=1 Tax=Pseudahrensia aquimaris TaxID=744461 RepID=A0ABW3FEM0_9HYPH